MKHIERFRVAPHSSVKLAHIDPGYAEKHEDKDKSLAELQKHTERLHQLQYMLYADRRHSVLICLQGLDASGKDGTVAHVFESMNPEGVKVTGFKQPTAEELAHDFLWRIHRHTPGKGEVAIFNRSHYEDVLVVRVHDIVPKEVWSKRYDRINDFERNLVESGTTVLKFYLHISEKEQLARFAQRLDDPDRRWKISDSDYSERKLWPAYVEAFEEVFHKTSTEYAPWYIIPANHKWFRNLAISSIVADAMHSLGSKLPTPTVDIEAIRKKYHAAVKAEHNGGRATAAR